MLCVAFLQHTVNLKFGYGVYAVYLLSIIYLWKHRFILSNFNSFIWEHTRYYFISLWCCCFRISLINGQLKTFYFIYGWWSQKGYRELPVYYDAGAKHDVSCHFNISWKTRYFMWSCEYHVLISILEWLCLHRKFCQQLEILLTGLSSSLGKIYSLSSGNEQNTHLKGTHDM